MIPDQHPDPVKLVFGLLYGEEPQRQQVLDQLSLAYSPPDHIGQPIPFDDTNYYEAEMGPGLKRVLVSLNEPVPAEELPKIKWHAHQMEQRLASNNNRTINIDPGYLDMFKLVLASFKGRVNKLYLNEGVWADLTLYYTKGKFHTLPWTFPDFAGGHFDRDLLEIRALYKHQLKIMRSSP